jgi:hypothetical protein
LRIHAALSAPKHRRLDTTSCPVSADNADDDNEDDVEDEDEEEDGDDVKDEGGNDDDDDADEEEDEEDDDDVDVVIVFVVKLRACLNSSWLVESRRVMSGQNKLPCLRNPSKDSEKACPSRASSNADGATSGIWRVGVGVVCGGWV